MSFNELDIMIIENKVYSNQSYCAFRTCDAKIDSKRLAFQQHVQGYSKEIALVMKDLLYPLFIYYIQKDRIDGLILMRPPTAWEERLARKDEIIENAR